MNVVGHDAPGIFSQPFVLNAIVQAVNYNVFIGRPGKNIYPVYSNKRDEV
jgi:hypothetical protein